MKDLNVIIPFIQYLFLAFVLITLYMTMIHDNVVERNNELNKAQQMLESQAFAKSLKEINAND